MVSSNGGGRDCLYPDLKSTLLRNFELFPPFDTLYEHTDSRAEP